MNKGFTLFEILISMAIFSGLVFVISMFSLDIFDFGLFLGDNIIAQQEIQLTIRVMVSEMRAMAESAVGSYPIESASQNSIIFYSDKDGDGVTERIRYYLEGNVLKKGVIEASGSPLSYPVANEMITESVHNIYTSAGNIFSYFNSDYSGSQAALAFPVNIPDVGLIKINLTVDPNPLDISSRINFVTSVSIRNVQ